VVVSGWGVMPTLSFRMETGDCKRVGGEVRRRNVYIQMKNTLTCKSKVPLAGRGGKDKHMQRKSKFFDYLKKPI
jgi:hypothetical protein